MRAGGCFRHARSHGIRFSEGTPFSFDGWRASPRVNLCAGAKHQGCQPIRPSTALVARAAAIAFPRRSRACMPDIAALGCVAATIPYLVVIRERPGTGDGLPPCAAEALGASRARERTAKVVIRITSVFFLGLAFLRKYTRLDDDREILHHGANRKELARKSTG